MEKFADITTKILNNNKTKEINKSSIYSFVFMTLFITPPVIYSIIPFEAVRPYFNSLLACYFFCGLYLGKPLFDKKHRKPLLLALSFVILGTINMLAQRNVALFNVLSPIIAYIGYYFIQQKRIKLKILEWFLIFQYIYYYFVYFSVIPDLFYRPDFDEDAVVFDNASSNAIPIGLNIILYVYLILNRFLKESNHKNIFVFSIINFALIIIQQSRAGLIVSLIILIIAGYEYNKKYLTQFLIIIISGASVIFFTYSNTILSYIDTVGNVNGLEALTEDVRGAAQAQFFDNMDLFTLAFGHTVREYSEASFGYTYNVFLDMWDRYGVLQLLIFFLLFISRVVNWVKFEFPLYYFIPFITYSLVESIFFPNFWDTIIYLLLFTPKIKNFTLLE